VHCNYSIKFSVWHEALLAECGWDARESALLAPNDVNVCGFNAFSFSFSIITVQ
jgi:hypothetical protein